jgi:hypothetical protein
LLDVEILTASHQYVPEPVVDCDDFTPPSSPYRWTDLKTSHQTSPNNQHFATSNNNNNNNTSIHQFASQTRENALLENSVAASAQPAAQLMHESIVDPIEDDGDACDDFRSMLSSPYGMLACLIRCIILCVVLPCFLLLLLFVSRKFLSSILFIWVLQSFCDYLLL